MEDSIGLKGKSETGTFNRVPATADSSSGCSFTPLLPLPRPRQVQWVKTETRPDAPGTTQELALKLTVDENH